MLDMHTNDMVMQQTQVDTTYSGKIHYLNAASCRYLSQVHTHNK
jgi:hypothetical protein